MLVRREYMSLVWYAQEEMGVAEMTPLMMNYLDRIEALCKEGGSQIESRQVAAVAIATAEQLEAMAKELTPSSGGR